jgi:DNA-directed RNA polymerase beta' subunit
MNIHINQSLTGRAELELLCGVATNIISNKNGNSMIGCIQDSILGAYLMTRDDVPLKKSVVFNMICNAKMYSQPDAQTYLYKRLRRIKKTNPTLFSKQGMSGKLLPSLILPPTFHLKKDTFEIKNGVLVSGFLDKSSLKSGHHCLLLYLKKEYDDNVMLDFLDNMRYFTREYLLLRGISIGFRDCVIDDAGQQMITDIIAKTHFEANMIDETCFVNPDLKEPQLLNILNKARDAGKRIAKDHMGDGNRLKQLVESGAKGDFPNITQITGLLGQQCSLGKRISKRLSDGARTLSYYPPDEKKMGVEARYESQGFVKNSFYKGLNPREYIFHSMGGREGLSDTASKTSDTGYSQRKLGKFLEDYTIAHDMSVRDRMGRVIQFAYGEDLLDTSKCFIRGGKEVFIDVERVAAMMNTEHELGKK